jgi:fermentation-respiration switch protein FrsA (DUF1100 family)
MADSFEKAPKRSIWLKRCVLLIVALATLIMFFRWFEQSQVYHPIRELEASANELGRPFEDVEFKSTKGDNLHGWYFPAETNSPRHHIAFLMCHGNAGNVSHRLGTCKTLLKTGAAVFVFDYCGFGRSAGKPGEENTYCDAQAAYAWLVQKGFRGENIIALGESLGGGVVSELALREKLGGVVLQSTFTSIPDIGAELFPWLPVRWLGRIKYDTHSKLPRIKVPVLVMHSRTDDLIKFGHGERNFAIANEPKFFCEIQGAHNDAVWEQPGFGEGIEKFLKTIENGASKPVSKSD